MSTWTMINANETDIEVLKERIAAELGFDLVDHRLELYGRRKRGGEEPGR